jgi:hypothetical protein
MILGELPDWGSLLAKIGQCLPCPAVIFRSVNWPWLTAFVANANPSANAKKNFAVANGN